MSRVADFVARGRFRAIAPPRKVQAELACLFALRVELRDSYPHIRNGRLLSIASAHGLTHFPAGFLIAGLVRDQSQHGASNALDRVRQSSNGTMVDAHPLFSQSFYSLSNPDVASAGIVPWLHYQVHGRSEGRTPHPLINITHLAARMPGVPLKNVVDRYLDDPDYWLADPGPYVDCSKFMINGPWNGVTNPLMQIVSGQLASPWIHSRLQLIDTDTLSGQTARLTGATYLLGTSASRRLAVLEVWALSTAGETEPSGTLTVIPGSFLGSAAMALWSAPHLVLSPDSTVIRLPSEILSIRAGASNSAARLINLEGHFHFSELLSFVAGLANHSMIAPFSLAQEESLTRIITAQNADQVTVLPFGQQARVIGAVLQRERPLAIPVYPSWQPEPDDDALRIAFMVTDDELDAHLSDPEVARMICAGALVCAVGPAGITPWLRALESRDTIVCRPALADLAATFSPAIIRVFSHFGKEGDQ